jgi:S-adenosylmethionine:tRNA ribosyltransferase-isomerase
MKTALFDYTLPPEFIAQQPAEPRDHSRLLVLDRRTGEIAHRRFYEIGEYLRPGDLLVANDTRVIAARLRAHKPTGGKVEIFLLRPLDEAGTAWECLVRGRGLNAGAVVDVDPHEHPSGEGTLRAEVVAMQPDGIRHVRFSEPLRDQLERVGEIPLPPYITGYQGDRERYQTVYSRMAGSVAAPTAGLHFTPELLVALRRQDVRFDTVALHVGLDTFQPITVEEVERHPIHTEWAELNSAVAKRINATTLAGGRVVAVGTTTVRTLEWAATGAQQIDPYDSQACPWQRTAAFTGAVDLFIRPGYRFRAVDALITNFHLPRSSLLLLVSAFIGQVHPDDVDAGRRILLAVYEKAKRAGYRFYSFGDAMLIV